jgi:hypothetical protein
VKDPALPVTLEFSSREQRLIKIVCNLTSLHPVEIIMVQCFKFLVSTNEYFRIRLATSSDLLSTEM